jgi:hypothetical protein
MTGRLTEGFRDIIELSWSVFVDIEKSASASNFEAIITAIARAASKGNLRAIQAALDRLDGKIATEYDIEMPKFYTVYPRATMVADDPSILTVGSGKLCTKPSLPTPLQPPSVVVGGTTADPDDELPTGSLRAVLERMLDEPKSIVDKIIDTSAKVDSGDMSKGDPLVKSVLVAGLMKLVHDGRISAVFEVFDQIDGKVAEHIKVLGDDVKMYNYSAVAPPGAELNEEGQYQIVNENVTNSWVTRLEEKNGTRRTR